MTPRAGARSEQHCGQPLPGRAGAHASVDEDVAACAASDTETHLGFSLKGPEFGFGLVFTLSSCFYKQFLLVKRYLV